jgi:CheY-like chemotaxis protein
MKREILKRIYEPFFTTKDIGKGTGLGLSVVHGIIESYKGLINVESTPGEGTTFSVFFPRIESSESRQSKSVETTSGGEESILLVDDEKFIISMMTQMLQRLGYTVEGFTSPNEALEVFQADPGRFDLVITDYVMPNMTGKELAEEIMNIRGDIPVILSTGFSENIDAEKARVAGIKEFVMKPVTKDKIAAIIRRVLDKKETSV